MPKKPHQRRWLQTEKGKAYSRKWNAARYQKQRAVLAQLKAVPCLDCRGVFPTPCMQFDHRLGTEKHFNVGEWVGRCALSKWLAEAAKCDVVCANCHAIRTASRRGA